MVDKSTQPQPEMCDRSTDAAWSPDTAQYFGWPGGEEERWPGSRAFSPSSGDMTQGDWAWQAEWGGSGRGAALGFLPVDSERFGREATTKLLAIHSGDSQG
eukprot:gene19189-biopygen17479